MKFLIYFLVFMSFQTFAATATCLCYGYSDDGYSVPVDSNALYAYEYEERCESSSDSDDCWNVDVPYKLIVLNRDLETKMRKLKRNEALCFHGSQNGNQYQVQELVTATASDITALACGKKLR